MNTQRQTPWRARCVERRTPGSASGLGKRTESNLGTAPQADSPGNPPDLHRTRNAIEAHLTIAFAALAVARRIQNQTGLAIGNVLKQLRPLRTSTVAVNAIITDIPAAQRAIISSLGIKIAY
jgi:hypothetical protein